MTIHIERIGNEPFISHVEIARTSANYYYKQAEDKDFDLAAYMDKHTAAIKAHLIRMESEKMAFDQINKHIQRRGFDLLADNVAFFELAQRYNWDETYFQSVLEALGEYDVRDYPTDSEAAA